MKTVITSEGNFLLASVGYYETAITRPYLNYCSLDRREEHRKDCVELYGISEYWNKTFGEGEFQCYDVGHDIGINNPYAVEILNSDILINN
jgi:hypothetical protein